MAKAKKKINKNEPVLEESEWHDHPVIACSWDATDTTKPFRFGLRKAQMLIRIIDHPASLKQLRKFVEQGDK